MVNLFAICVMTIINGKVRLNGQLLFPSWCHLFQLFASKKKIMRMEPRLGSLALRMTVVIILSLLSGVIVLICIKWLLAMQRPNYIKSLIPIGIGKQLSGDGCDIKKNKCLTESWPKFPLS